MPTSCWLALHAASGIVVGRSTRSLGCMDTDYLEASPQSRRRLVLFFVFALVVGVVAIESLEAHLDRIKTLSICDQITTFHWLWTGACLGLAALGVWAGWLAQRSLKLNQWPLPGAWVFHRTPIHRGNPARWRAYALLGWSVIVLVGSTWSWYVVESYVARVESQRCVEG
jgi:hypothetical protein